MRNYATVSPAFWTGETGRQLRAMGPEAVMVALYLMTSPHSNMIGLYYLPLVALCHETGLGRNAVFAALQKIESVEFAFYDEAGEVAWVPEMARYQIGEVLAEKDKKRAAVLREIGQQRKSRFFGEFVERYGEGFNLPTEWREGACSKGHAARGMHDPSMPPGKDPDPVPLREQGRQEKAPALSADAGSSTPTPKRPDPPSVEGSTRARGASISGQPICTAGLQTELLPAPAPEKPPQRPVREPAPEAPTTPVWTAYAGAYRKRWGTEPVRNQQVNGQLAQLLRHLGAQEAAAVAAHYLTDTSAFYVAQRHPIGLLLRDYQKLRAEWVTGTQTNMTAARQQERTAANPALQVLQEQRARRERGMP